MLLIAGVEWYLRFYWGFCDTVLLQSSDKYEYIAQPNQDRFRFRNHIFYNQHSMRSSEIKRTSIKILGFGDSVINGGTPTTQNSLATHILSEKLSKDFHRDVQVCNISAGSWGPDNCFAYLQEKGHFNSKLIFLVVSSHDAYDNMDFQKVVDVHPSFPSKQSFSAIFELLARYVIPKIIKKKPQRDHITKKNEFNSGFLNFYHYTQKNGLPFFIYLHPDKKEIEKGCYDHSGKAIIQFCQERNISLIQGINLENSSCFRDDIHLNEYGQQVLANALLNEIKKIMR
jgi:lysophospholipase L1-like esterase